ncbi:MAG: CRISPR-associated endonuclease Cas1 [Betaproteobacteria bacterium]
MRSHTAADGANAPRAADARTLYLGQSTCQRVDGSGDALVVSAQREGGPLRRLRFPLERVARVVSSTALDWSGAALQLCLQRHLSICWLDGRGVALGSLHSHGGQTTSFATALDVMLESPLGLERYQAWLKSRRMQVQLQWGRSSAAGISPQQWESSKRSWVYQAQLAPHLPAALYGFSESLVASELQRQCLLAVQFGPCGESVPLARDLTQLLWAQMNLCCGTLADPCDGGQETTLLFERWQAQNGSALWLHLGSLNRAANQELQA